MNSQKHWTLSRRIDKVRKEMAKRNIDAMLISKTENKNYLSMFYSSSFDILITEDRNYLLTDFRYIEAASELKPLYDVVQVTPEYTLYDFIAEEEPLCLGLEFSSVTMNVCKRLEECLEECESTFEDADGIVEKGRMVKDEEELDKIRQAARIADEAFSYILG